MRPSILRTLIKLPTFLTLAMVPVLRAGIRPSFSLDSCAWRATHIVLVETTPQDAVFVVKESWKGDLKNADTITVSQLKPDADAVPIEKYPERKPFDNADADGLSGRVPRQSVSSHMILFLRRRSGTGLLQSSAEAIAERRWEPAGMSIKTSVLWLDAQQAFCFLQWMNPGPSALGPCIQGTVPVTLPWAKARVAHILKVKDDLASALRLEDPVSRVEQLKGIAYGDSYNGYLEALEGLGKSGSAAVPALLQIMNQPPYLHDHREMVKALMNAAGQNAGSVLNDRLKEDLSYWKAKGPELSKYWWNQDVTPTAPLRMKYSETIEIIRGLSSVHYVPARETAAQLRDLWLSYPQLNDPSGLDQLAKESDQLVRALQSR